MDLPIKLRKEENAIKEATISLFLSSPIIKPERFEAIIKDSEMNGFFHSFQNIGAFSFSIENVSGTIINKDNTHKNNAGFRLEKFFEGKPEFVLQGMNQNNRNYFSFHDLSYKRWSNFIENYTKIFSAIQKIQSEIFLTGISLHYIDEFIWVEEGQIDLSKIMVAQNYLPQNFIKIKNGHLVNTREIESQGDNKLFDRLEVLLLDNIAKTVTISHNQTLQFNNLIDLKEKDNQNKVLQDLQQLHDNNKKFLNDVLLLQIKKLIGLE